MGCYAAFRVFRKVTLDVQLSNGREALGAEDVRLAIGEEGRMRRLWRPVKKSRGAVTVQTGGSEP